jgi:hypothetical protein
METVTRLDWTKKVAIVLILVITTYLLFRYLYTQKNLYDSQHAGLSTIGVAHAAGASEGFTEGMESTDEKNKDIKHMIMKDVGSRTQTVNPDDYPDLTMKDFIVKSSYNTAYTGSTMSLNAVSYALERGYRYLDFEVYLINGLPCVGYSEKPKATPTTLTSSNSLPLGQVLYTIATEAFSAPVMNTNDPLFINFRIYSKDNTLYEMVAKSIEKNIKNRMYSYKVDADTELKDIMGKIVVFVDVMAAPDYDKYPNCSASVGQDEICYNLSRYINTESGGVSIRTVMYENLLNQSVAPPSIDPETKVTNLTTLKVTYPEVIYNLSNPDLKIFVLEYGVQFTTVRLNIFDTNLKNYENFFADCNSAFVPISQVFDKLK